MRKMRKIKNPKSDDAQKTQSGLRDTLIKIATERRRQVNIQPTSPAYVSDLKVAVNEIAAGMANSNLTYRRDVVREMAVSSRKKQQRNIVDD